MRSNGGFAKYRPINVRPQLFAFHGAAGQPLNVRASLGGNMRFVLPSPNGGFRYAKLASKNGSVADDSGYLADGGVCTFHLESIDYLYLRSKENLIPTKNLRTYSARMKNQELLRKAVSDYVLAARKHAKLTQSQLGDLLGCGKQNVSGWENGLHSPSPIQIANIAYHTKLKVPELLAPSEESEIAASSPSSAREIANALLLSIRAIADKWGVLDARDLLDPSPEARSRVEQAIAAANVKAVAAKPVLKSMDDDDQMGVFRTG